MYHMVSEMMGFGEQEEFGTELAVVFGFDLGLVWRDMQDNAGSN